MILEANEGIIRLDGATRLLRVDRWLKAITALLNADASYVVLSEPGFARIIGSCNIPHPLLLSRINVSYAPYRVDEVVVVLDATKRPDLHEFLGPNARSRTGFFYRRPLYIVGEHVLALVVYGETPRTQLTERELKLAADIAEDLAADIRGAAAFPADGYSSSLEMTRGEVEAWVQLSEAPGALFDSDLKLVSVNEPLRKALPIRWDKAIGRTLASFKAPSALSLDFLFRRALDLRVSTPRMDIVIEGLGAPSGLSRLRVLGAPVTPIDAGRMLVATVDPQGIEALPRRSGLLKPPATQEATAAFMLETLVPRRALRSRNDVSYVTLRSWRQSIRKHQITALRAIKRNAPDSLATDIGKEIASDVRALFGAGSFRAVVPVPCSHSPAGRCLSVKIAQAVGLELGLTVAYVLAMQPASGKSHPMANLRRPPMRIIGEVQGPVLLVDDVATSGRHIEEAAHLLREAGANVLAVAWIGGDVVKD